MNARALSGIGENHHFVAHNLGALCAKLFAAH